MTNYQVAAEGLSLQHGIDLILDAAAISLDWDDDGNPTDPSLFAGIELALSAVLSDRERPAAEIIREACTGTMQDLNDSFRLRRHWDPSAKHAQE